MKNKKKIIPVILSGGIGERLWPLSTNDLPKQFINLKKDDKNSLFQQTLNRVRNLEIFDNPIIVCNEEHRFLVAEQIRQIGSKAKSILLEPIPRNTCPAVTIAAFKATEVDEDAVLLILPSDHHINNLDNFKHVVNLGYKYAIAGRLTAFGVTPTSPETGYGYIKSINESSSEILKGQDIDSFIEKPNLEKATEFFSDKKYSWNSGIYIFKARNFLDELNMFEPEIYKNCKESISKKYLDLDFQRLSADDFKKCSNISIDVAVMERTNIGTVIKLDAGWSDIGSWIALWRNEKKDSFGNVKFGKVDGIDTTDSYLRSEDRLLVGIGLRDLIVVETRDVVLVANKEYSQQIKSIVNNLKNNGNLSEKPNRKIYRPWGNFISIGEGDEWQVKIIEVKPGASLSLQIHQHRSEHWIVIDGTAKVEIDNVTSSLSKNESIFVPINTKHRLSNPNKLPLKIIEVQSGSYLGEDDILRFDDIYGRHKKNPK